MTHATLSLLLFTTPIVAADPPPYKPDGGRFSVQFTGAPKEHSQSSSTRSARSAPRRPRSRCRTGPCWRSPTPTTRRPLTATPDALLLGGRDGLKGKVGNLLADAPDPFGPGKLPSRSVLVDTGKLVVRARLVAKGERLYQVTAVGTKEAVKGPAVDAFFDSFALGD